MLLSEIKSNGTYVCLEPTASTLALVQQWAAENKIPLDQDLHVTVLYSRSPVLAWPLVKDHVAEPIGFDDEKFGDSLVLTLKADSIVARHDELIGMGGTHDFDSYDVHMTLIAKRGDFKAKDLSPMQFRLTFNNERWALLTP